MKKITTLMAICLLLVVTVYAQAPDKFTYQAVVRNASNALVINSQVGVRVNILQGSATGDAVYSESHVTTTNANGLVTVSLGGGSVLHGSFAGIDWADGPYFLKTDIDPNGGNDYSITTTQQLLSVPYALYAKEAGNGFSGDYNDLTNRPQIPQIPADVSAFNNDAGYITAQDIPTMPTVPTNVSAFTNDAGYLTNFTETDPNVPAWAKEATKPTYNYSEIINTPTIPTVPDNVSSFTNDAGYITSAAIPTVPTNVSAFVNDAGYVTSAQVPAQVNADWNATSGTAQILNKPALFSGNYHDLTNKPTLFDGNYNALSNKPNLSAVALSGSYNDLLNKPSIPTAVGELTNNVGYITAAQVPANVSAFTNDVGYITNSDIPAIPINVSAFTNDALYVTEAQLNMILSSMTSTIDSLRDRIREIEAGATPAETDTTTSDTTVIPDPAIMVDGQPCPGMATITDYDGNVYNTVAIGQQCWMKENLRTTHSSTGSPIVYNTNTTIPKYGYLYSWDMAMRDICPLGWHVPTEVEWTVLTDYVSGQPEYVCGNNNRYIALAMAADTGWMTSTNDCAPGKNLISHSSTGFDILPAGFHNDLVFNNDGIGGRAYFWSSTQYCCGEARYVSVGFISPTVSMINTADMSHGFSVRCVRDEFSEDDVLQMIETSPVLNVTPSMANCGGEVFNSIGITVFERGVCWSTTSNPTFSDNHTTEGEGTGVFNSILFGLVSNTTYYVRAYVYTNRGVKYGNELSFTTPSSDASFVCGLSNVSDIEGNTYSTIQIGDQCWMKENLRTTHYSNGIAIMQGITSELSTTTPNYYNPSSTLAYGYQYNWPAVKGPEEVSNNNQGICPTGWHVPNDGEWTKLIHFVRNQNQNVCGDNRNYIARSLASSVGWDYSIMPCAPGYQQGGFNATGFSALTANGKSAGFWTSTEFDITHALYRSLYYDNGYVSCGTVAKSNVGSVRCLRD